MGDYAVPVLFLYSYNATHEARRFCDVGSMDLLDDIAHAFGSLNAI